MAPSDTIPPDEPWTGDPAPRDAVKPGPIIGTTAPDVRTPRVGIAINGNRLDRLLLSCEVTNNRFFAADTFRASLRMDETARGAYPPAWFGAQDRMEVELFAGLDARSPPTSRMIMGRVDDVEVDFTKRVVSISGRDLTADFLETQTTEKWPNRTSSEIARDLAGRHGMTAVVTDTSRPSGHYYKHEHARLTDEQTEWNLLTYLAEQEGFDCFVRGKELHFGPPPDPRAAARWELVYRPATEQVRYATVSAGGLRVRRNLTVARDILVRVVSWNAKQKRSFTVTRRSSRGAGRGSEGRFVSSTPHVFRLPGLTEEQAIREAERQLRDLTRQERVVEVSDIPAAPDLDVRTVLVLRGTGTSWDLDYSLDQIDRRMTQDGGFTMDLRARNLAPQSTASL